MEHRGENRNASSKGPGEKLGPGLQARLALPEPQLPLLQVGASWAGFQALPFNLGLPGLSSPR